MQDYQDKPGVYRQYLQRNVKQKQQTAPQASKASTPSQSSGKIHLAEVKGPITPQSKQFQASPAPSMASRSLLQLQNVYGNRQVQRLLQASKESESEATVSPDVERTIDRTRGGGHPLDSAVQKQMGQAFNADFSAVRVHTNAESHALNQNLNARAFTTGKDIYFRQGEYNPGSSAGRELLAHEMTHVVQQNGEAIQTRKDNQNKNLSCSQCATSAEEGAVQTKLTLGRPGDIYEQEADHMAGAISRQEQMPSPAGEEEKEKEMVQTKQHKDQLSRQPEEEEEPLQTKLEDGGLHRQVEEEEDMNQTS